MTVSISMRDMLEAGVHFGHKTRYWNPQMRQYIFGARQKMHIINLQHTLPMFRDALECIAKIAENRGRIMFVGTKYAARDIVREEAVRSGMPYVNHRWLGGMLTNYKTIRQSVKRLKDLEVQFSMENAFAKKTKKEVLSLMREKDKLSASLDGIKNMGGLPDALFVVDVTQERIAIQEANRLRIPVIAIVDTNADPEGVDYVIPANDDASRAIRLYCKCVADTIIESRGVLHLKEDKSASIGVVKSKKKVIKTSGEEKNVEEVTAPQSGAVQAIETTDSSDSTESGEEKTAKKKVDAKKKVVAKKVVAKKKTAAKKKAPAKKKTAVKKKASTKKTTTKKKDDA